MKKNIIFITLLLCLFSLVLPLGAKGAKEKSEEPKTPSYSEIDTSDMLSSFNYSYGYIIAEELLNQGHSLNAPYYLRGILDGANILYGGGSLVTPDEANENVNNYISSYYEEGLYEGAGDILSKEELEKLEKPVTIVEKFSYSYGLLSTLNDIYSGVDILPEPLMQGAAECLYKSENNVLNSEERENAFNTYKEYYNTRMMEEYTEYVEGLKTTNAEEAETFLNENKDSDGVKVLKDGLQIKYTSLSGSTEKPSGECTVNVDYKLEDLSGNVYDQNEGIDFPLGKGGLISGFEDALYDMSVGDEAIVYIHPSLGYGENGSGQIEPNKLLVFTIKLNEIK